MAAVGAWGWGLPAKPVAGACERAAFPPPQHTRHPTVSTTPFTFPFALDIANGPSSVQKTFPANPRQNSLRGTEFLLEGGQTPQYLLNKWRVEDS